jgi:hypothetical protein
VVREPDPLIVGPASLVIESPHGATTFPRL